MLKSIGAVAGSYVLSIVLVFASDPLLSLLFPGDFVRGRIPSNIALAASTGCFIAVSIFCAWLCGHFAPAAPSRHVLWFFVLGEAMGIVATIANWNNGWPHWYALAWVLSWPVSCWIGARFAARRTAAAPAGTHA
jgi:hypothetical protein